MKRKRKSHTYVWLFLFCIIILFHVEKYIDKSAENSYNDI